MIVLGWVGPCPFSGMLRRAGFAFTIFQSEPKAKQEGKAKKRGNMGSRLGRRVIHFANLPIKLLMPSSFTTIKEIALKTIPSASKIEIKRVLESLYGFDVEKVHTLNMEGKKKKRGGLLIAKPDYKKAYVTLRTPLSVSPDLYPIRIIEEDKRQMSKQPSTPSVVEEGEAKKHWLDGKEAPRLKTQKRPAKRPGNRTEDGAKFPWSSMRSAR